MNVLCELSFFWIQMRNKDFHLEIDNLIHFMCNFEISNFVDIEYLEHLILLYVSTCITSN